MPGEGRKILKNIAWATGGKVTSLLGGLVVGIIVARYLGPEQYGLMNYVISVVSIFQVFADFGLDFIQIREEAQYPSRRDRILGTVFGLKLILALFTVLAISIVVWIFEKETDTRILILIYSLSVILNTTWVSRNHFTAIVWNEYIVKTEISRTAIGVLVKVLFVLLHLPLLWFILSLVFDSLLLAVGYTLSYARGAGSIRRWRFDASLARHFLSQSWPLLLSGAAIIVYNRIDQIMIARMTGQQQLGIYSVAVRFAELLVFVPTVVAQTVSPVLARIRQSHPLHYERQSRVFVNVTVALCIGLALLTCMLSWPLVRFTFGTAYVGAASVLSLLAFKVIGDALSQTSGQLIIIEGLQRYAPLRNLMGCAVCLVFNLLLIPRWGLYGAACTAICSILVSGTLANALIPAYRPLFRMQLHALFMGWKDIKHIKTIIRDDMEANT